MNKINYSCWIQGIYMTSAIGACLSKNTKYPSEPLDIGLDSEKQKEIKKRKKTEDAYKRLLLWSHSVKGK